MVLYKRKYYVEALIVYAPCSVLMQINDTIDQDATSHNGNIAIFMKLCHCEIRIAEEKFKWIFRFKVYIFCTYYGCFPRNK